MNQNDPANTGENMQSSQVNDENHVPSPSAHNVEEQWGAIATDIAQELFTADDTWPGHCGSPDYVKLTKERLTSVIVCAIRQAAAHNVEEPKHLAFGPKGEQQSHE